MKVNLPIQLMAKMPQSSLQSISEISVIQFSYMWGHFQELKDASEYAQKSLFVIALAIKMRRSVGAQIESSVHRGFLIAGPKYSVSIKIIG